MDQDDDNNQPVLSVIHAGGECEPDSRFLHFWEIGGLIEF